jgi:hypothetical protein
MELQAARAIALSLPLGAKAFAVVSRSTVSTEPRITGRFALQASKSRTVSKPSFAVCESLGVPFASKGAKNSATALTKPTPGGAADLEIAARAAVKAALAMPVEGGSVTDALSRRKPSSQLAHL